MKKKNEIEELYEKNKKDNFVNYNDAIEEIESKINDLFNHQNEYTSNVLIIKGEYGTGKTFIMSEILKNFSDQKKNFESEQAKTIQNKEKIKQLHNYYIDLSTNQSASWNIGCSAESDVYHLIKSISNNNAKIYTKEVFFNLLKLKQARINKLKVFV